MIVPQHMICINCTKKTTIHVKKHKLWTFEFFYGFSHVKKSKISSKPVSSPALYLTLSWCTVLPGIQSAVR